MPAASLVFSSADRRHAVTELSLRLLTHVLYKNTLSSRRPKLPANTCRPARRRFLCTTPDVLAGGARDIGAGCAIELARAGADVVINYNSSQAAALETVALETVAWRQWLGRQATAVQADVW